jgi:lysozyme
MAARARIAALGLGAAVSLVAGFEGLRTAAYVDPVGIPTICYGHTENVQLGMVYSPEKCQDLLAEEFLQSVNAVHRCSPKPLAPNELGALASAVYNIGPRLVCDTRTSTLARKLQAGDIRGACEQLPRWNKGTIAGMKVELPGLTRRRQAELAMCIG